jgi:hypothetical protein
VRDVIQRRGLGVELVDVLAIAHDRLAVRDVEVAGDLVDLHGAVDGAALVGVYAAEPACVFIIRSATESVE